MTSKLSSAPFAEPLWYTRADNRHYNDSHVKLRQEVREYVNTYIAPFCEEWEKNGAIPSEVGG